MSNLAILFADVAGSTGIYQRHGDRAALQWIGQAIATMTQVTETNAGRIVKTIGDEVMAVFTSANDAFRAACDMQWQVDDLPSLGNDRIALRVGFHYGPAIDRDGDVFGDSVNLAARLVGLAKARQIITSGRTLDHVDRQLAQHARRLDRVQLKGMASEETIFEALWDESEELTTMLSTSLALMPARDASLVLRYEGVEIVLGPDRPCLTLGRDPTNDVVVVTRRASRVHARIEWRRDKFVLVDQSTNGTYVSAEPGGDVFVRLEELPLRGHGAIGFGHPVSKAEEGLMEFRCQDCARPAAPAGLEAALAG